MRFAMFCAVLAAASGFACSAVAADREQVALLQSRTIFHSGLRSAHTVALTFDDGPNANTIGVLDVLKSYNVKATFFIVGRMAHRNPDILRRIAAEGHLLANHSATHALLGRRFDAHPELLLEQLRDVNDQIAPLMRPGDKLYFRAPYGAWRSAHAEILNADPTLRNYVGPIYWDVGGDIAKSPDGYIMSSADWDCWRHKWSAMGCAKGYLREIRRKNGGVVLMHCVNKHSAELVADVLPALVEEGYAFARLDQVPAYKQFDTPPSTSVVAMAMRTPVVGAGTAELK
jgi:peptidoglycan/xylan/chitin deacetylase (PgdA/CDA1 family)